MSFEKLLKKLCVIQTKITTQSGTGSFIESWGNTYTDVKCRYQRSGAGRVLAGAYQVTLEDFTFYFLPTQVISIADRIVVDEKTYVVNHVFKDSAGHHQEVYAKLTDFA